MTGKLFYLVDRSGKKTFFFKKNEIFGKKSKKIEKKKKKLLHI